MRNVWGWHVFFQVWKIGSKTWLHLPPILLVKCYIMNGYMYFDFSLWTCKRIHVVKFLFYILNTEWFDSNRTQVLRYYPKSFFLTLGCQSFRNNNTSSRRTLVSFSSEWWYHFLREGKGFGTTPTWCLYFLLRNTLFGCQFEINERSCTEVESRFQYDFITFFILEVTFYVVFFTSWKLAYMSNSKITKVTPLKNIIISLHL